MKNLNEYVQKIWGEKSPQKKRELIKEMINFSSAKDMTKKKYLMEVEKMPDWKLDFFCSDYSMSGNGLKVIK